MDIFLSLAETVLREGFIYALMAMGVLITYKMLDFPDLSVDGTFPLGACVTAALITAGVNPWLACILAFLAGAAAGCVTGVLHVKFGITDLLSGILVMTAMWSVNLVITHAVRATEERRNTGGEVQMLHALKVFFRINRLDVDLLGRPPVGGDAVRFLPVLTVLLSESGKYVYIFKVLSHLIPNLALYSFNVFSWYIEHETFKNNLLFLDCCMPRFVAECLLIDSLSDSVSDIKDAVKGVVAQNPFNFTGKNKGAFYEHKMKVLLLDAALGMTPAKEWNGRYDANGGYIVVRKDGEIVCYHFYNRNDVEDYLYCNTRFERASRSRYKYGSLFRGADGNVYIRLNLQIRFKK